MLNLQSEGVNIYPLIFKLLYLLSDLIVVKVFDASRVRLSNRNVFN